MIDQTYINNRRAELKERVAGHEANLRLIRERIAALNEHGQQTVSNIQAIQGALQELDAQEKLLAAEAEKAKT